MIQASKSEAKWNQNGLVRRNFHKAKIIINPPMLTTIVSLFVFESTDVGKNPLTFSVEIDRCILKSFDVSHINWPILTKTLWLFPYKLTDVGKNPFDFSYINLSILTKILWLFQYKSADIDQNPLTFPI